MKKLLTFVLSIALVLCMVTTAFAAQVTQTVDKTTVYAGEDVTVTLTLDEKLSNVVSFQFDLYFDSDLLLLSFLVTCVCSQS